MRHFVLRDKPGEFLAAARNFYSLDFHSPLGGIVIDKSYRVIVERLIIVELADDAAAGAAGADDQRVGSGEMRTGILAVGSDREPGALGRSMIWRFRAQRINAPPIR
jgi:hypothetical protein